MEKHLIVVFAEPEGGQDDDFNAFYTGTHMPEVLASAGVVAAQRFKIVDSGRNGGPPHPYLTIYEIEGDLDAAKAALAADFPKRTPLPDSFSRDNKDWWFTAISERLEAGSGTS